MKKYSILIALLLACMTHADMGSISLKPGVVVMEPNQNAIIAHNGSEQLLILSVDLMASEETKVLEIMPFPSEPSVDTTDSKVFKKITWLLNDKQPRRRGGDFIAMGASDTQSSVPSGVITFHEVIGAHDVSVAKANDSSGFFDWVANYLASLGEDMPEIPPEMSEVIEDYINDGFRWFVLDVIDLSNELISKDALLFEWESEFLFYPMRITRTERGNTTVKLLILTEQLYKKKYSCIGLPHEEIFIAHDPVVFSARELEAVSPEIYDFLDHPEEIKVRHWQIRGDISSFEDDLIVTEEPRVFIKFMRNNRDN